MELTCRSSIHIILGPFLFSTASAQDGATGCDNDVHWDVMVTDGDAVHHLCIEGQCHKERSLPAPFQRSLDRGVVWNTKDGQVNSYTIT